PHGHDGWNMTVPLGLLALLSLGGGWFGLDAVSGVLPDGGIDGGTHAAWLVWATALVPITGVVLGVLLYGRGEIGVPKSLDGSALGRFLLSGWQFDKLYDLTLVRPFVWLAQACRNEPVDRLYDLVVSLTRWSHGLFAHSQSGQLRWYATTMGLGIAAVLLLAAVLL
ncbi:MAG: hypothetical protein RIC89_02125, partial [Pseudomonadales bacterium]